MSRYGRYGGETKVYVGNLGTGAGKGELERAFGYYGPLRTVWIARNPPGFAFVEFEDPRDAEDAVRGLDGKVLCGSRVRVELSTGMPRRSRYDRPPTRRPFDPNDRCYECGEKGHYAYDCHRYSRRRRSRLKNTTRCRDRLIDTSRSPRSPRPWSKEGRPANLQDLGPGPGPGPVLAPGPVGGGTLARVVGAVAADHVLLLQEDPDLEHPRDQGLDRGPGQGLVRGLHQGPGQLLIPRAGLAQVAGQSLALQQGATQNLDHRLQNKAVLTQEAPTGVEAQTETTDFFPFFIEAELNLKICTNKCFLLRYLILQFCSNFWHIIDVFLMFERKG
ncbi:uncharacterized protein LOC125715639 isoform X2 [Brienomyrus brachyistius]|uniref:uncharacterized protein LOC125715639 isoform X2 n=1 Tax=Brienomyrus brachyistius TaxID=42636 RepID=UPI0020B2B1F8|nr:uncharacterized protein LOC125715639 isoform X2 [Brienomyrus brachyistius]